MAKVSYTTVDNLVFPFKNYVLALPGWYPTWLDPMPGDFNQRHIIAASQEVPQIVLYIGKDSSGSLRKTEVRYRQLNPRAIEVVVVYPKAYFKAVEPVKSNFFFLKLLYRHAAYIFNRWGRPQLLHCYIAIRGGLAGYLLHRRYHLPYVLTENWTIYYPNDPGYLPRRNMFFKWSVQRVYNHVARFLPVTANLQQRVQQFFPQVLAQVIPNVADTAVFFPGGAAPHNTNFRFVHVSTMIYQKNAEGLLRVFAKVLEAMPGVSLTMVGPYPPGVKACADQLGLTEPALRFAGPVDYQKVAAMLRQHNALVLFSRYENLPCVILEAFCTGLPVISTNVGGIAEVITPDNGLLVPEGDEAGLQQAMIYMVQHHQQYNPTNISKRASQLFGYEAVGKQIGDVYRQLVDFS